MNLFKYFKSFFRNKSTSKVNYSKRHKMTMKEYLESLLTASNIFMDDNENSFHYYPDRFNSDVIFRYYLDSGTVCKELAILDYTNRGFLYKNVKVKKIEVEPFIGNSVYFSYESREPYKKETPESVLKEKFSDYDAIEKQDYYRYRDDFNRLGYTFDVIDGVLRLREPK